MLPASWQPVRARGLARVGSDFDGGYVVPESVFAETDLLLSFGLGFDWSFEEDFRRRSGCRVLCFDGMVFPVHLRREGQSNARRRVLRSLLFASRRRRSRDPEDPFLFRRYRRFFDGEGAEHRLLNVGYDGNRREISFASALAEAPEGGVFVKMDIEGGEYRALDALAAFPPERLAGVAVELHDVDLHRGRITEWLAAMRGQVVAHLHANNHAGVDARGDPIVVEMTLARAGLVEVEPGGGAPELPRPGLDAPNRRGGPERPLRFGGGD